MKIRRAWSGVAVVGVVLAGALAATAGAAAPGAVPGTALVRVAHLSPDTAGVDVYVDGARALGNVNFETVSDYQSIPAGRHKLELRPAGAAATSDPVLATTQDLASQEAYTVAGVGTNARLRGKVFSDDLTSPAPGTAKVRAIHAAVDVPAVDITLVGAASIGTDIAFGTATPYAAVPPGRYQLQVTDHDDGSPVLTVPDLDVGPGIVYSVAAIGGTAGKPVQVLPLVDARGAEVLPAGAVHTGAGGTATRFASADSSEAAGPARSDSTGSPVPTPLLYIGAIAVVLAGVTMTAVPRRRRA
jgi:hypothetical protein